MYALFQVTLYKIWSILTHAANSFHETPLQKQRGNFLACVMPRVRLNNRKDPSCTIKCFVNPDTQNCSGAYSQLLIGNVSLEPFRK